jgi:predicted nucleic acid-binding protein
MAWVVDTCILIDVAIDDPTFGRSSAYFLQSQLRHGLLICPVTYVEIGPVFNGDLAGQERFLEQAGIDGMEPWTTADTRLAHQLWAGFILNKRQQKMRRRPVADVLIGAFATRFEGLVTRNPGDFHRLCPGLKVIQPRKA